MLTKSSKEAELLVEAIDCWVEGLPKAKELTIEDGSVQTLEQLLELTADYDDQTEALRRIREEVQVELRIHREYDR